ncbi:MAG: CAP domain-containing protein [Candidatus Dormibacteria bacterium]
MLRRPWSAPRRPAAPAMLALAAGLAACAPAVAPVGGGAVAGPGIAAVRQLVFANHYQAAGVAFEGLLSRRPGDAESRAWYALFLNYRHDSPGALLQAETAVRSRPRDGLAQAVLCRVNDWSNHLVPALRAGRSAVALAPAEPLGHLFLSEALADDGDITAAADQLAQASSLLGFGPGARSATPADLRPYLRAELAREQANLAHDRGDRAAQLSALGAAREAQPAWVERLAELAQVELQAGQVEAARATLSQAVVAAPEDPEPLRALLDIALTQPDYAAAAALLPRAARASGGDVGLLDIAAQVAMASAHDPAAARNSLISALRRDPTDVAAAAYLLALARYGGAGDETESHEVLAEAANGAADQGRRAGPARPLADPDAAQAATATVALREVNLARARAGLGAVRLDRALTASAAAHAWYWLFNNAAPEVAGLGIHRETPGRPGYRGVHPWDRAAVAGYATRDVGEDITHRGSPTAAVADWVNSVYHRFPILRPDLVAIGYADVVVGPVVMEDMEFGFDAAARPGPAVLFPGAGQSAVPASFVDNELPDPVPAGAPRITGYPVSITFPPTAVVRLASFTLGDSAGSLLATHLIAPSAETENSAAVLAAQPLRPGAQCTAAVTAMVDGRPFSRTWTFTVATSA